MYTCCELRNGSIYSLSVLFSYKTGAIYTGWCIKKYKIHIRKSKQLGVCSSYIHCVPKSAITFASNTHDSVCSWWILTKYQKLHQFTVIIYRHTDYDRALPCVFSLLSVTSLWRHSLLILTWRPSTGHRPKSLHQGQGWPVWAQTLLSTVIVSVNVYNFILKTCQVSAILD